MSQTPDPSESELAGVVRGSWHRFLDAYEPLRSELYRYCRHLTRSPWDAEDLAQDALTRAFVTLGQLGADPPNPRAWLFRVASNQARSSSYLQQKTPGWFGTALCLALAGCAAQPGECKEPSAMQAPASPPMKSGHAAVNGISLYYEIHGNTAGTPLVLLHGGGSTIAVTYGKILPFFARHRTVLALEEQGHGRTSDRDAPVRFDTSAEDVASLLDALHVEQADVMGFSNGASVALRLAIRHPTRVRRLVFASSITKKSGAAPQFWEFLEKATFADMPQPLKDAFLKVNPDPQKLRVMHDKDLERMHHFVETTDDEVRQVKVPTLVLQGDHDVPTPEHGAELSRLFPRSNLLILPGGHGDYLGEITVTQPGSHAAELTAKLIEDFLDARE